jgi:hypothetical protein
MVALSFLGNQDRVFAHFSAGKHCGVIGALIIISVPISFSVGVCYKMQHFSLLQRLSFESRYISS